MRSAGCRYSRFRFRFGQVQVQAFVNSSSESKRAGLGQGDWAAGLTGRWRKGGLAWLVGRQVGSVD